MKRPALLLLLCWLLATQVHAADPANIQALKAKGDEAKTRTVVFKGFYLGMPLTDAQTLLNHHLGLPPTSSETADFALSAVEYGMRQARGETTSKTPWLSESFKVFRLPTGQMVVAQPFAAVNLASHYFFATGNETGSVKSFSVSSSVRNKLFDADKMSNAEFARSFATAYGLPELTEGKETLEKDNELAADGLFQNSGTRKVNGSHPFLKCLNREQGYEACFWGEFEITSPLEDGEGQLALAEENSFTLRDVSHLKKFD